MFGYGVGYAVASLSCTIGPFLAVTASTFHSGSLIDGIAAYLAYAAGMALLIGVLATAIALAAGWVTASLRGAVRHLTRIGAVLLVLTGAYVAYYGVYELRLNVGAARANDPVIDTAAHLQQQLSSWVGAVGALPALVLLAGIIAGALWVGWGRAVGRRRARRDR
jgi:cytochrome c-type biogenesis protein